MFGKRKQQKLKKPGFFGFILAGLSALVSTTLIVLMSLIACDYINLIPEYVTVNFYGENNELLQTQEVLEFSECKYKGVMPTKSDDGGGPYIFIGWDKFLKLVYRNTDAHAIFLPLNFFEFGGVGELPDFGDMDLPVADIASVNSMMPGPIILRESSFGNYENGRNLPAPEYSGRNAPALDGLFENPVNFAGAITASHSLIPPMPITITYKKNFAKRLVPVFSSGHMLDSNSDAYYAGATNGETYNTDTFLIDPIHMPDQFNSFRKLDLPDEQRDALSRYRRYAEETYLDLNRDLKSYVKSIVREDGLRSSNSNIFKEVGESISKRIKFDVLKGKSRSSGQDPVVKALTTTKIGNASIYANLAVEIFRYLKMPARYAVGYVGFVSPEQIGTEVNISSAFAWQWPEVFVDGIGWVAVQVAIDAAIDSYGEDFMPGMNGENEHGPTEEGFEDKPGPNGEGSGNGNGGPTLMLQAVLKTKSKTYDGEPFIPEDIIEIAPESKKQLAKYNLEVKFTCKDLDKFVNAGVKFFNFEARLYKNGKDVTEKWNFESPLQKISLSIRRRMLQVEFDRVTVEYDEKGHTCPIKSVEGLLDGEEFAYKSTAYVEPGDYRIDGNAKNVTITRPNNHSENLAANYQIIFIPGMLSIV